MRDEKEQKYKQNPDFTEKRNKKTSQEDSETHNRGREHVSRIWKEREKILFPPSDDTQI